VRSSSEERKKEGVTVQPRRQMPLAATNGEDRPLRAHHRSTYPLNPYARLGVRRPKFGYMNS